MPAVAAVALLPKAADVVSAAVGSLLGKETKTDRDRQQHAAALEAAALQGDASAVRALEFEAFDPRGKSPADTRTPKDGKYSPAAVRDLAVKALRRVSAAGVPLSSRERYAQLKVPLPSTQSQQIVRAIVEPVAERFAPEVGRAVAGSEAVTGAISRTVVIAGVVAVVLVVALLVRGSRA